MDDNTSEMESDDEITDPEIIEEVIRPFDFGSSTPQLILPSQSTMVFMQNQIKEQTDKKIDRDSISFSEMRA